MSKEVDFPNNKTVFEGQIVRVTQHSKMAGHKWLLPNVSRPKVLGVLIATAILKLGNLISNRWTSTNTYCVYFNWLYVQGFAVKKSKNPATGLSCFHFYLKTKHLSKHKHNCIRRAKIAHQSLMPRDMSKFTNLQNFAQEKFILRRNICWHFHD